MTSLPFSKIRSYVVIAALLLLAGGIGYSLGERRTNIGISPDKQIILNQTPPQSASVDFSLFWDVWQRLFRYYIDAAHIDSKKLVEGAITGMVNSLGDPYTTFLPPKENVAFKEDLGGAFEGIGAQLGTKDNHIIVQSPLKGTPAEKAGIKAGDWIIKVNSEDTSGWTIPQAVDKIRGPKGTKVTLNILHTNAQRPTDIVVERGTITVPSVVSWVKRVSEIAEIQAYLPKGISQNDRIGYIELSRFGDNSNEEWTKAVDTLLSDEKKNGPVKGVVFDLRNNPGGYLEGAVFIASEFIKSGTVVSQANSDGSKQDYAVSRVGRLLTVPVIVLVNQGSASASEIVAGALKDYGRAKLVGEKTFGKGSVQTPQELKGGASLHVTTGKWLLPKGAWIHKIGIEPDVKVSSEQVEATADAQLAKAVELLLK